MSDGLREIYENPAYVDAVAKTNPYRLERLMAGIQLSASDRVCDFGCGAALLLPWVGHRVAQYVGVDFSHEFIAAAERHAESLGAGNASFACEEIAAFCAERPASFDVAFAMDFSEHVHDAEWVAILRAIRSSLKPGGLLYLHTPNGDFVVERLKAAGVMKQTTGHIAVRNPAQNATLLQRAGFAVRKLERIGHYNVLRHLHTLSRLPVVGRYFVARLFIEAVA
jgi:2-polyprenyl-3-methyl-5-hydroxy-6-metoxy-1,4-benzoquinol methylase